MSDWTWEYIPDSAHVVGGLTPGQCAEAEALAQRIADAIAVRVIGRPFNPEEAVSGLKSYGEGLVTLWYQEDYRDDNRGDLPRAAHRPRRRAGRRVANRVLRPGSRGWPVPVSALRSGTGCVGWARRDSGDS